MHVAEVAIRPTRPDDVRVLALLSELDAYLYQQYPLDEFPSDVNHILEVSALLHESVTFLAAWRGDVPVACGAVRRMVDAPHSASNAAALRYGEIKRMYVRPQLRGQRVGERIVAGLEAALLQDNIRIARLETGTRQPEALRLYERCGYRVRGLFGGYTFSPVSVYMEKAL